MYLKTKAMTKQIIMTLGLVGCISVGFAQNSNAVSVAEASEHKLVSVQLDRASLSQVDKINKKVEETTVFSFLENSEDYTIMVRAIKAVGLEKTLSEKGRYTVFAPNNAAFNMLPEKTLETLFEAENRETLKGILSYHIMPGNQGVNELTRAITGNGGRASLKTLNGTTLTATLQGDKVVLLDANGAKSTIISGDKVQTNGMVHAVNAVVIPN